MPEDKNECRTGMPCGLPKSGNACMNRTTACCLKCGWNPDEQVRILKSQEPSLLAERIRQAAVRD